MASAVAKSLRASLSLLPASASFDAASLAGAEYCSTFLAFSFATVSSGAFVYRLSHSLRIASRVGAICSSKYLNSASAVFKLFLAIANCFGVMGLSVPLAVVCVLLSTASNHAW